MNIKKKKLKLEEVFVADFMMLLLAIIQEHYVIALILLLGGVFWISSPSKP